MNTQIIAIANQKGGVGKTTTCANLGIGLAQAGKKVLLIDGDPQGSLTISLGNPQPDKLPFTLSDAMGKILMDQPIRPGEGILHHAEGVDLMPADIQLSGMEVSLVNAMSRETILRQYLDTLKGQYSHILIDCQPSLGMLTVNALAAANRIIIPVQAEYRRIVKAVIYHRKRKGRSLHNRGCDQSLIRKYFLMNGNGCGFKVFRGGDYLCPRGFRLTCCGAGPRTPARRRARWRARSAARARNERRAARARGRWRRDRESSQ